MCHQFIYDTFTWCRWDTYYDNSVLWQWVCQAWWELQYGEPSASWHWGLPRLKWHSRRKGVFRRGKTDHLGLAALFSPILSLNGLPRHKEIDQSLYVKTYTTTAFIVDVWHSGVLVRHWDFIFWPQSLVLGRLQRLTPVISWVSTCCLQWFKIELVELQAQLTDYMECVGAYARLSGRCLFDLWATSHILVSDAQSSV